MATNPHGGDPARRVHVRSLRSSTSGGAARSASRTWARVGRRRGQPKMSLSAVSCGYRRAGALATLKATPGAVDANAFATRAQAAAIFEDRPGSSAWAAATDANQDAALIQATAEFGQRFTWRGEAASTTQALAFPRTGLTRGGVAVAFDSIPQELIRAVSLFADFLLAGGESPGGVLDLGSVRGIRVQAQDALPGLVLAALPAAWVRSHVGSTVGSVSF